MQEFQTVSDNLTGISEGRRIVFYGLISLMLFCVIPFDQLEVALSSVFNGASEYLRVVAATGVPPVKGSLF